MQFDPPPAGENLDFVEFAREITAEVRRLLPGVEVRGTMQRVVWTFDGRTATMTAERAYFSVTTANANGTMGMAPLNAADRRDRFVARNLARSIAGFFDARLSTP